MSSFVGAIAIADMVKTTLGPKGMDKILQSVSDPNNRRITITNDGATILKSVPVENPAAKVLVDIAKVQDDTVGDGTTRSVFRFEFGTIIFLCRYLKCFNFLYLSRSFSKYRFFHAIFTSLSSVES